MVAKASTLRASVWAVLLLAAPTGAGRSAELVPRREGVAHGDTGHGPYGAGQVPVPARGASARHPFVGYWATDRAACLDPDSDGRMAFGPDTIDWYETRCRIRAASTARRGARRLDLACRGEGQRMDLRATVSLPTPDALIIDDGPIGPSKRQRYIRCKPR